MLPIVNILVFMRLGAVSMVNLFRRSKKKKTTSNTKETSPQIQSTTHSTKTLVTLPPTNQSQQPIIITQQQEDYIVTWAFMKPEKEETRLKTPFANFPNQKTKPAFNNDLNKYQSDSTPLSRGFSNPRLDILNEIQQKLEKRRKMIEE